MSHTPGPWRVNDSGKKSSVCISGDGWFDFAKVYTHCDRKPQPAGFANARLIAAAPDLLAALQAIAQSAATIAALDSCREIEVLRGIAGVCRAAIAKATGADK